MKKHTDSTWHELTLKDVVLVMQHLSFKKIPTVVTSLKTTNGQQRIYSNISLFTLQEVIPPVSPVLLDKDGLLAAKALLLRNHAKYSQKFDTLTTYLNTFPLHKIFLRTISTTQRHDDRRVVATEVLELIPILLQRQRTNAKKLQIRLEKYKKRWACTPAHSVTFSTISIAELAAVLDDFDIDKSQLTLVPDICFATQVGYQFQTRSVNVSICTTNAQGMPAIHVSQAVFMLFNGVAMEVDWNTDIVCEQHTICNVASFRRQLLDRMNHYARMGERMFANRENLFKDLEMLKVSCQYKSREKRPFTPGLDLLYCDYSDRVRLSYLFIKCQEFGFKHIVNNTGLTIRALDAMYIPAWKARFVFIILWMDMFFSDDEESNTLRKMVNQAVSFKIPSSKWTEDCDPLELVFSSDPEFLRIEKEIARRNAVDLFESSVDTEDKYSEITHTWWNEQVVKKWQSNRNIIRCGKWSIQKALHKGMKSANKAMSNYKEQARKDFPTNYKTDEEMSVKANEVLMKILVENRRKHAARPKVEGKKTTLTLKIDRLEATLTKEGKIRLVKMTEPKIQRVEAADQKKEPEPKLESKPTPEPVPVPVPEREPQFMLRATEFVSLLDVQMKKRLENQQLVLGKVNALNEKAKRGIKTLRVSRQIRLIVTDALKTYGALYHDIMQTRMNQVLQKDLKVH